MKCSYCGNEMRHGEITTNSTIIRWIEGVNPISKTKKFFTTGLEGNLLRIPHYAFHPWIPADYCGKCRKMIFETEIIKE